MLALHMPHSSRCLSPESSRCQKPQRAQAGRQRPINSVVPACGDGEEDGKHQSVEYGCADVGAIAGLVGTAETLRNGPEANPRLYPRWLALLRALDLVAKRTDKVRLPLNQKCDGPGAPERDTRLTCGYGRL